MTQARSNRLSIQTIHLLTTLIFSSSHFLTHKVGDQIRYEWANLIQAWMVARTCLASSV